MRGTIACANARQAKKPVHKELSIQTNGPGLYEFTETANAFLGACDPTDGILTLFVRHTSCSIVIQENADPEVQTDLAEFF